MLAPLLAHGAWLAGALPGWVRFRRALQDPAAAQAAALRRLLAANAGSDFGRKHAFGSLCNARDFQNAVPISQYEDLAPWIDRIRDGEPRVLTEEPVLMFEKTSGSASAAKYIPYTASLRREFQRAIHAWMADLYGHRPGLATGPAYWSVSPLARAPEKTPGGLPVGFEDDTEYFGPLERRLVALLLAVPQSVARLPDMDAALHETAHFLLRAPALRFISVWSPTFFLVLWRHMQEHAGALIDGLRERPGRARELRADFSPRTLWPNLRVLSCWTDGSAAAALPALRALLPGVEIQPKGLLATEGVVSIPRTGHEGATPALTSHFLEFLPEQGGEPLLAHELEHGRRYSVLMSTGGGLWRYDLGDLVEVCSMQGRIPQLRFAGRRDASSDLCGEKLSAAFVGPLLSRLAPGATFAMLAPLGTDRYALFIEEDSATGPLAALLDQALSANPHYAYCRALGQLRAPAAFRIRGGAAEAFLRRSIALGQRAGDIKPTPIHRLPGWESVFDGAFTEP